MTMEGKVLSPRDFKCEVLIHKDTKKCRGCLQERFTAQVSEGTRIPLIAGFLYLINSSFELV